MTVYKMSARLSTEVPRRFCAFRLRMLPDAVNYVLLAEDF